jgi:multicomponent K+:H+ antiporter subunit E
MKRWLPYPLLWLLLFVMWLVLNESVGAADVAVGALVALGAVHSFRVLQPPPTVLRRPLAIAGLAAVVIVDIVRSNVAVAQIVLRGKGRRHRPAFVHIPLELRHPAALTVLACIITATPGTVWARYDSARSMLILHVLDVVDENAQVNVIKRRYERPLMEIFE